MSSTPPPGGRLLVEPLEARIAPTGLTALANNTNSSSDPNYVTYNTQPTADHLGFVKASTYLGASAPANLYAIKMTGDNSGNGDKLLIFNGTTGFNPNFPSIQAVDKTLIAFFQDTNGDGQVQANELVGLSLTKKSAVSVFGNVNGDIVTNLSKDGTTVNLTSVGKPGFAIASLNIAGNVNGNILAGGNINSAIIGGNVGYILAGTATNNVAYNFSGVAGATTGTISEGAFPLLKPGASISNLSVTSITPGHSIHAGDGGLGAVGGDVSAVTVTNDTGAFNIIAGNGGFGNSTYKGGAGGNIAAVTIEGVADTFNNQLISLHAGNGGENDVFRGGTGGSVTGVATSFDNFDTTGGTGSLSADLLTQNILVHAGDGGTGLRGGRGGDVSGSSIYSAAPDDGVVSAAGANAEIQVVAGHGGLPAVSGQGHGGAGGNVSQVFAEDLDANADGFTSSVLVQGGDGGAGRGGGTLTGITLLGSRLVVNAGNGADGVGTSAGGTGGSLSTIVVDSLTNLLTHQLTLNAGSGGSSQQSSGGLGGNVDTVTMLDSDLSLLSINDGNHANGGVGSGGTGGAGGTVSNIQITNSDMGGQFANVTVRSGIGGDGHTGGGTGGDISNFQMFGVNFKYAVTAGYGGQSDAGAGGAGGNLNAVGVSSVGNIDTVAVGTSLASVLNNTPNENYTAETGVATAGVGGNGANGGGAGGSLTTVDLRASYDLTLQAGYGGTGGAGAGGDGGSITSSAGVSLGGSFTATAGFGAGVGNSPTNGGNIASVIASAQANIAMTAGHGGSGGTGGNITGSGTTPNPLYVNPVFTGVSEVDQTTSNFGNVTITAGAGSSAGGVAGAGGSVTVFTGSIGLGGSGDLTSFGTHQTSITAGAGGGGNGDTASGAGGSVSQIQLTGSNSDLGSGQTLTIDGGAAGQATAAKRGAAGGDVSNATIYNLDTGTVIQHIAAGDGANAVKKGGAGGSISEIHVGRPGDTVADIGIRSGVAYGYGPGFAGGLFAGVGGTGSKLTGVNGDVTDITANAISSIVAGKGSTIHLVNNVDGVILEGSVATAANADGSFTNFDTANLIGSVQNPAAAGASTFKTGDGLIAATTFTFNRDFTPEALLTLNASGVLSLVDYQQPALTPVVSTSFPISASL